MNIFFEKDNHDISHGSGSKSIRVICCLSLILSVIFLNALLVQNTDASRLYTARQGAVDGQNNDSKEGDNAAGDNAAGSESTSESVSKHGEKDVTKKSTKHVQEAKIVEPSETQDSRTTTHTATLDPKICIKFDSLNREITISCEMTNLSQVHKVLNDPKILKKEGDGIWLLNANLTISDGASFTINSNDTKWLKINSTDPESAYQIRVIGNMKVDSVRISSWNTTSNNYTSTDGNIHRASIAVVPKAEGKADFTNSEISHLGYDASPSQGLSYIKANGGLVKNNAIHHLWYGFYSRGLSNMVIEDNDVYDNVKYGLDPHTGSHDLIIRHNRVHDNEGLGIVCSLDCKNITIEGNEVFGNKIGGIMLSRNVENSIVVNNTLKDEVKGIIISESNNDKIYNNVISNSDVGIEAKSNSSNNNIYNNSVLTPAKYGIQVITGAKENNVSNNNIESPIKYGICVYNNGVKNQIIENIITNSSKHGICIYDEASNNVVKTNSINGAKGYGIQITDANVKNNTFYGNAINMTKIGISVNNNTDSAFVQNIVGSADNSAYSITGNSILKLYNTTFVSDKISSSGGDNNTLAIADSGIILISNGSSTSTVGNGTSFDTTKAVYTARMQDPDSVILTSK